MGQIATKEQERKALAQIIEIVEGLGENSYIGTAFEGCFDIARDNIENDFACSMKGAKECVEKQLGEAKDTIRYRESELADREKEVRSLNKTLEQQTERIDSLENQRVQYQQRLREAELEASDMTAKADKLEEEVIRLKAKLFDLLYKDE